jgi:hypothetical protein
VPAAPIAPTAPIERSAPNAPTAPTTAPITEPLARFQEKLTNAIFSVEARKQIKPSPHLDTIAETLRYVWDALEASK